MGSLKSREQTVAASSVFTSRKFHWKIIFRNNVRATRTRSHHQQHEALTHTYTLTHSNANKSMNNSESNRETKKKSSHHIVHVMYAVRLWRRRPWICTTLPFFSIWKMNNQKKSKRTNWSLMRLLTFYEWTIQNHRIQLRVKSNKCVCSDVPFSLEKKKYVF